MNAKQREELLGKLKARFEKNMSPHKGIERSKVQAKLEPPPENLRSLGNGENAW